MSLFPICKPLFRICLFKMKKRVKSTRNEKVLSGGFPHFPISLFNLGDATLRIKGIHPGGREREKGVRDTGLNVNNSPASFVHFEVNLPL